MDISAELDDYWRDCSDDELATWFRDPAQWSYVLRAPNGELASWGKAQTRAQCEEWAVTHAEEFADERAIIFIREGVNLAPGFQLDYRWDWSLLGEWHFKVWQPTASIKELQIGSHPDN
jgi:hypothetical protein